MPPNLKYARIERERRFLLAGFPAGVQPIRVRAVTDRYVEGARLRLRRMEEAGQPPVFKLTQKLPARSAGAQQGFITTMYLDEAEFSALSSLPARILRKVRHSIPPFGIDVFEGALAGLILAEAEFETAEQATSLAIPPYVLCEVTDDDRFTGGALARATREELAAWLAQYGASLQADPSEAQLR